ncbi:pantoate--beta-alanine ligase [Aquimarina brevivitae]|uniref:Pantothenate synthetase n=1 Tax=Aquimarina brevivitae TaxID=323412 RepID=A0A4Q7PFX5_9FLAO|nr:pantoate--beta-alanine ligase [Aquimarina brevivitae]RZS99384.1 pantothenate synthetase [Aquimarina brevivitae]
MELYTKRRDLEAEVAKLKKQNLDIGFVPTMGALHSGHLALVKQAAKDNEIVVVSIFVNPTQFNNKADLAHYPRTLKEDMDLLTNILETVMVFAPAPEEVYGEEAKATSYDFGGLELEMEGKFRPGHFNGVGTVLKHLFDIVKPDRAYFGEKDYQQLQIVKKLVEIEKMAVQIIGCPIYRESSGLALSSRNTRLNSVQTKASPKIYEVLKQVKEDFGTKSVEELNAWVSEQFSDDPDLKLEYFEIANAINLKTAKRKNKGEEYRAFIAVFAGEVRLIDNIALN